MALLGMAWAKPRKDEKNSGRTGSYGLNAVTLDWSIGGSAIPTSDIVVGNDNRIRFIADGKLYITDVYGVVLSPAPVSRHGGGSFDVNSSIVLDSDCNSYIVCKNGPLQKYDSTGLWVWSTAGEMAVLGGDTPSNNVVFNTAGNIVLGTSSASIRKKFYEIDPNSGDMVSSINVSYDYLHAIPAVDSNRLIAVMGTDPAFNNYQLVSIDLTAGTPAWYMNNPLYNLKFRPFISPSIDGSSYIYAVVSDTTDTIIKVNITNGAVEWAFDDEGSLGLLPPNMGVSVDNNNNIYFVNSQGVLYAVTGSTGLIRWKVAVGNGTTLYPVTIDHDNNIYLANQDKSIYKVDSNGTVRTMATLSGVPTGSVTFINDRMYIPTNVGVSALKLASNVAVVGYNVYRQAILDSDTTQAVHTLVKLPNADPELMVSTTVPEYYDNDLQTGNYYYYVRAVSVLNVESSNADRVPASSSIRVDTSAPGKPVNLRFEPMTAAIKILWDKPTYNTDGTPIKNSELLMYDVYRTTVPGTQTTYGTSNIHITGFMMSNKINPSVVVGNEYIDEDVVSGYFYYYSVRAKDFQENAGPYADEIRAALNIYKITIKSGKNVIGFPFNDTSLMGSEGKMTVEKLVAKLGLNNVSKVMRWNENAQVYEQYPDFDYLESKRGYIVVTEMNQDVDLDVYGTTWENVNVSVKQKLNLINLPLNDFTNVEELIYSLGGSDNVQFVCRFNPTTGKYEEYIPALQKGDFTTLEAGFGYFVFLTSNVTEKNINFSGLPWV